MNPASLVTELEAVLAAYEAQYGHLPMILREWRLAHLKRYLDHLLEELQLPSDSPRQAHVWELRQALLRDLGHYLHRPPIAPDILTLLTPYAISTALAQAISADIQQLASAPQKKRWR